MLTRNIKGKRREGERGDTEIRLIEKNERKYRSGAGLHGKHERKQQVWANYHVSRPYQILACRPYCQHDGIPPCEHKASLHSG